MPAVNKSIFTTRNMWYLSLMPILRITHCLRVAMGKANLQKFRASGDLDSDLPEVNSFREIIIFW